MKDLISRQQAIDTLENTKTAISENGERYIAKQNAIMRIDALPSAQPTFDARDTQYNLPIGTDLISRQQAIDDIWTVSPLAPLTREWIDRWLRQLPPIQPKLLQPWEVLVAQAVLPQPKRGKWILDRSGAYCCSECMEPCAGYFMMKPRDKFCKMCGSRNEVTE